MRVTATLCACALLVVAPAEAGASGKRQLARAKKLLEQFKDRAALRALQRARRARGNSRRLRAEIWMYIGIANYNLLKRRRASRAFRRALKAYRNITLPSSVSPKIRALWRKIDARLPKPKPVHKSTKKPTMLRKPVEHFDDPPKKPVTNNTAGNSNAANNNSASTNNGASSSNASGNATDPLADGGRRDDGGGGINWPAWISAGVALGAAGAAIGLGFAAKAQADKAADLDRTYEAADVNHAKASERALVANIMIGVAGAAAVTSVIFFIVGRHSGSSEPVKYNGDPLQVSPGVSPVPGGVVLGVSGRVW